MVKLFIPKFDFKNQLLFEIFEYSEKGDFLISKTAENLFVCVENYEDSDWIIIPVFITSLSSASGKEYIKNAAKLAQSLNKPFGVFSNSDLIINPGVENVFVFTPGAYSTYSNLIEIPATLPYDPVQKWKQGNWLPWDPSGPLIGFCGQATINPIKMLKDALKISKLRQELKKGGSPYLNVPNFLPAWERARILKKLQATDLRTDFILRSRYKAGASSLDEKEKVEEDFYQNIDKSLFTVCLRGMGNYSVRFYQTLAMGRIPILIDTDSVLPFSSEIPYDQFILKVSFQDRFNLKPIIESFVKSKTEDELISIQKLARECWIQHFQTKGMIKDLEKQMRKLAVEMQ
ncbi:MAG: hypothetical protein KGZ90_05820 [Algoriphagus sp.]|nr:hypothetical protein [Algoriphagus sp.]